MKEWIKDYYNKGFYTKEQVEIFVQAGWITEQDYQEITGGTY